MKDEVKMIPIDQIRILNPRHRDRKKFEVIVQSIKNLGLKKPIQVSLRSSQEEDEAGYDLVCGQGRIEAFIALGHKEIPAIQIIHRAVIKEPFGADFRDQNPPEPTRASRRDRTLMPLRPLCFSRARSGLRTAQLRGASVGRLAPVTPLLPPFR
jgi:hypothetical protein